MGSSSAQQHIYRSTDGSTWNQVDISGLGNISSLYANGIYALTSDGNGTWFMACKGEIYKSTDDAASWSLEHTVQTASHLTAKATGMWVATAELLVQRVLTFAKAPTTEHHGPVLFTVSSILSIRLKALASTFTYLYKTKD